jgi:hypothetical protein
MGAKALQGRAKENGVRYLSPAAYHGSNFFDFTLRKHIGLYDKGLMEKVQG